jgi:hypothetical protein
MGSREYKHENDNNQLKKTYHNDHNKKMNLDARTRKYKSDVNAMNYDDLNMNQRTRKYEANVDTRTRMYEESDMKLLVQEAVAEALDLAQRQWYIKSYLYVHVCTCKHMYLHVYACRFVHAYECIYVDIQIY